MLEYEIKCKKCGNNIPIKGDEYFNAINIQCNKCGDVFENYYLDHYLNKFAESYFGSNIEYHIEDHKLWLDTKNTAIFFGFYNKKRELDINKIYRLCNDNGPFIAINHEKGKRYKIDAISIYHYQRLLKKQSIGMSVKEAAEKLGIRPNTVRKRIKLDRSNKKWIQANRLNPYAKNGRFIVYLE